MEGSEEGPTAGKAAGFASVIVQIMVLDVVFSLDSVITAVGMADHLIIMATAIIIEATEASSAASTPGAGGDAGRKRVVHDQSPSVFP